MLVTFLYITQARKKTKQNKNEWADGSLLASTSCSVPGEFHMQTLDD